MRILFLHPNMPGQYKHMCRVLAEDEANEVVFLTKPKPKVNIPNVTKAEYTVTRQPAKEAHRYLIPLENAVFSSQEVWRVCKKLQDAGFTPDVIVGHFGWGDGLFLKDIFPDTPILAFAEFFYHARGADANFLEQEPFDPDHAAKLRMRNAMHVMNLTFMDWVISPTKFQFEQHPEIFHPKMSMLHDGVDTEACKPGTGKTLTLPDGTTLKPTDEIITYISRNFEPYRGFPQFMRAAEQILQERPHAHVIIVGQDDVSYGKAHPSGRTWREVMMDEVELDAERFHYLGYIAYHEMVKIMQISSVHIYLTVPFVLSWSMMEAMACGCLMIVSDTPPVREVAKHEYNCLMVDFFDHEQIVDAVNRVLEHPDRMQELRNAARETIVKRYALDKVLPLHCDLVRDLAQGKLPPPTAEIIKQFDKETSLPI